MLAGLGIFNIGNIGMEMYFVMAAGLLSGVYCYHMFKELDLVYVGILGSVIAVAFCELISVIGYGAASESLFQLIAMLAPLFEYFLVPFAIGQIGNLLYEYFGRKVFRRV